MINDWFSHVPKEDRSKFRSRLRSLDGRQFRAAFWELYLHETFLRLGFSIEIEPPIANTEARPDFFLTKGEDHFYLEAAAVFPPGDDEAADQRRNRVYESLDKLDSPNFFLWLDVNSEGPSSPPASGLRSNLYNWLRELDPDLIIKIYETQGFDSLPRHRWTVSGWDITFRAIPKKPEARGKCGSRPLGAMGPSEAQMVDTSSPIRSTLESKGGKYGDLNSPYVIAVTCDVLFVDELSFNYALFGTEAVQFWTKPDGTVGNRLVRSPDGFWAGKKPRYTRVSAVLTSMRLQPWTICTEQPVLWFNPWAQHPIKVALPWATRGIDLGGSQFVSNPSTTSPHQILGLPAEWPGPDEPFPDDPCE